MLHEMKLQANYFDYILYGTKRIELRLNDEKRRNISVNDIIVFKKEPLLNEEIKARVTDIFKYDTFTELIDEFDISVLADKTATKAELLSDLEKFYTKEKQKEYGVIGIKIELV